MTRNGGAAVRLEAAGNDLEEIEIRLLLDGIRHVYGYDFREYSLAPLWRGLEVAMLREGVRTVSAYQDRILHDAASMQRFLSTVGVNVTGMFRESGTTSVSATKSFLCSEPIHPSESGSRAAPRVKRFIRSRSCCKKKAFCVAQASMPPT